MFDLIKALLLALTVCGVTNQPTPISWGPIRRGGGIGQWLKAWAQEPDCLDLHDLIAV